MRDGHYAGSKELGNAQDYKYPHAYPEKWVKQQYLPDKLRGVNYFQPKKPGNMKELLELIKNGSISYLGNTRGINENDCKKLIFPLAIIFKSGIIKT